MSREHLQPEAHMITYEEEHYEKDWSLEECRNWIEKVLAYCQKKDMVCAVHFCSLETITDINLQYRGKDRATDVLSFSQMDGEPVPGNFIGDILICIPYAREQAFTRDITLTTELQLLMVHGILHLLGYDHENDNGEMLAMEKEILLALTGDYFE